MILFYSYVLFSVEQRRSPPRSAELNRSLQIVTKLRRSPTERHRVPMTSPSPDGSIEFYWAPKAPTIFAEL